MEGVRKVVEGVRNAGCAGFGTNKTSLHLAVSMTGVFRGRREPRRADREGGRAGHRSRAGCRGDRAKLRGKGLLSNDGGG